jgi:hypothetical protein
MGMDSSDMGSSASAFAYRTGLPGSLMVPSDLGKLQSGYISETDAHP